MQLLWTFCICHYVTCKFIKRKKVPSWCSEGITQFKISLESMTSLFGKEFNNIIEALAEAENALPQTRCEYKKCKLKISILVKW